MIGVIGDILVPAVIIALSPPSIIAVVMTLLSPRARRSGSAFVLGWVLGLSIVGAVILIFADVVSMREKGDQPSQLAVIVRLVIGLVLIGLAVKQWKGRPKEGAEPSMPKWMQSFDTMSVPSFVGVGAALSGVNPKTVIFAIAAITSIAESELAAAGKTVALIVFIVLSSVTVAGLVIWYFIQGERANAKLLALSGWLAQNNAIVMSLLFLFIGVTQIGKAMGGLNW